MELVNGRIKGGTLIDSRGNQYPIIDFIPRFIKQDNYCESFSVEWEQHPELLFGQHSNYTLYQERFYKETRWGKDLKGQLMLEAGCGPGALTSFALETGATVVSFDASTSVEQNYKENGQHENVLIVQADIYEMPFPDNCFDKVFCFGVLQHTPSPRTSLTRLGAKLKPGGEVVSDIYTFPATAHPYRGLMQSKYFLRKFTADMDPRKLYNLIRWYVNLVWYPSQMIGKRIPGGVQINRRLLLDDYPSRLPGIHPDRYREFARLDIFDFLSPKYDIPSTLDEFRAWHQEIGLEQIEVNYGYNGIEGRGKKPFESA